MAFTWTEAKATEELQFNLENTTRHICYANVTNSLPTCSHHHYHHHQHCSVVIITSMTPATYRNSSFYIRESARAHDYFLKYNAKLWRHESNDKAVRPIFNTCNHCRSNIFLFRMSARQVDWVTVVNLRSLHTRKETIGSCLKNYKILNFS